MSDTTLIQQRDSDPVKVRVHERFEVRGFEWAVTDSPHSDTYTVTHVLTGTCANLVMEDTPEEAKTQFFDWIEEYDDEEIERLAYRHDPVAQTKECPRCGGTGHVDANNTHTP